MEFFKKDNRSAMQAIEYAQHIAFAPIVFQASRALRNLGLLEIIESSGKNGIAFQEIVSKSKVPEYGITVLLEAGLGIGLLTFNEGKYYITKTGSFILNDPMTRVNMDFVHDICYLGMFELEESIRNKKPEGLKIFGKWNTVYEALSSLPEKEKESWFDFDHFYSDDSFDYVLPEVFRNNPSKILDIGGNTGKFAQRCLNYSPDVQIGIADLPGQLNMAKKNIEEQGFSGRVSFYEVNMLNQDSRLPKGYDVIWMSQFLDCFSEDEIVFILERCYESLEVGGEVYILETFWNRQRYQASAFSLQMTSLYFTNIANGNSRMYDSDTFKRLVEKAGLKVEEQVDNIGISHSLMKCRK